MKFNFFIIIAAGFLVAACSAGQDDPGLCKLKCSNTRQAANNFTLKRLSGDIEIACAANFSNGTIASLGVPIRVTYQVTQTRTTIDRGSQLPNAAGEQVPVAGISISPDIAGSLNPCATNPENYDVLTGCTDGIPNGTAPIKIDPASGSGIATPKSQWCSDSCGLVTFEFVPFCIKGATSKITASIISGSVRSEPINVSIVNSDKDN